jgi:hypothetical protein
MEIWELRTVPKQPHGGVFNLLGQTFKTQISTQEATQWTDQKLPVARAVRSCRKSKPWHRPRAYKQQNQLAQPLETQSRHPTPPELAAEFPTPSPRAITMLMPTPKRPPMKIQTSRAKTSRKRRRRGIECIVIGETNRHLPLQKAPRQNLILVLRQAAYFGVEQACPIRPSEAQRCLTMKRANEYVHGEEEGRG